MLQSANLSRCQFVQIEREIDEIVSLLDPDSEHGLTVTEAIALSVAIDEKINILRRSQLATEMNRLGLRVFSQP